MQPACAPGVEALPGTRRRQLVHAPRRGAHRPCPRAPPPPGPVHGVLLSPGSPACRRQRARSVTRPRTPAAPAPRGQARDATTPSPATGQHEAGLRQTPATRGRQATGADRKADPGAKRCRPLIGAAPVLGPDSAWPLLRVQGQPCAPFPARRSTGPEASGASTPFYAEPPAASPRASRRRELHPPPHGRGALSNRHQGLRQATSPSVHRGSPSTACRAQARSSPCRCTAASPGTSSGTRHGCECAMTAAWST